MERIIVSERHITEAQRMAALQGSERAHLRHASRNPIALAAKEALNDEFIVVTERKLYTSRSCGCPTEALCGHGIHELSKDAVLRLQRFYNGDGMAPFCFDLAIA